MHIKKTQTQHHLRGLYEGILRFTDGQSLQWFQSGLRQPLARDGLYISRQELPKDLGFGVLFCPSVIMIVLGNEEDEISLGE